MSLHTRENIAKEVQCSQNMGSFVEHYTLGSSGHCRIGDFGPRRQPTLDQGFEHLRGPDNRNMAGLANPKDLLLDLSHSLETNLDPEIATSYHDGDCWPAHCRKQNSRKRLNRRTVLDFKDDSSFLRLKAVEFMDQFGDILGTPDK